MNGTVVGKAASAQSINTLLGGSTYPGFLDPGNGKENGINLPPEFLSFTTGAALSAFDIITSEDMPLPHWSSKPDDYLVVGGYKSLCVDTENLREVLGHLAAAQEKIKALEANIASVSAQLDLRVNLKLAQLSIPCVPPDPAAETLKAEIMAAHNAYVQAQANAVCNINQTDLKTAEFSDLLGRAAGLYEMSEGTVLRLLEPYFVQAGVRDLADFIVSKLNFPLTFTVGGVVFHSSDLTSVEKAAVFLSFVQGQWGKKIYGNELGVNLHGPKGRTFILTYGFQESPELRKAFGNWTIPVNDALFEGASLALGADVLSGIVAPFNINEAVIATFRRRAFEYLPASLRPEGILLMRMLGDYYPGFAASQEAIRQEKQAKFPFTLTGRALGNMAQRMETKPLGLGGEPYVENPDGSVTRNLPRRLGDVFSYGNTIDPYDSGAFEIQQWETSHGKKGVRVILRGTESWDAGSKQVQDMLTNTEAVAGLKTGQAAAVRAALEQLGVDRNTPVELVGHSQAGIVAANLASDKDFTSRFKVSTVITAGSPIAQSKIPEDIKTLSLENTWDQVPRLDGAMNPASPEHITVYKDFKKTWDAAEAHNRDSVYAAMANDLQGKHYAEIDNFLECRDKYLGLNEEIVKATSTRFEVSRT